MLQTALKGRDLASDLNCPNGEGAPAEKLLCFMSVPRALKYSIQIVRFFAEDKRRTANLSVSAKLVDHVIDISWKLCPASHRMDYLKISETKY